MQPAIKLITTLLIGALVIGLLIYQSGNAGSPGTYRDHIYRTSDKVRGVLKQYNGEKKCHECFLYRPLENGFMMNFYTVTSKKVIDEIINIASQEYFNQNSNIYINFNFYTQSHTDRSYGFLGWGSDKPFIALKLYNKGGA